jgi:hypothetical protein
MDLSPSLLESLIMLAIGGVCFWLWHLKGKAEDVRDEADKKIKEVRDSMHELEKKLIAEYASKADLKEVVRESLAPLKEAMQELKGDLRATIAAIDGYKKWGPPE